MNQFTFAKQTEKSNNSLMRPVFFLLWFLKQISIRFWFNPIIVSGKHNIPRSGPVVLIGNHSNAFLDPVLAAVVLRRGIHFLTRGDVFKGKFLNSFFRSIQMLPIFRRRDGLDNLKKNDATFEQCWKLLQMGKMVLIYPEGDCVMENHLRPFRPGLNKLIFEAYKKYPEITEIPVVPCGITYTDFHKWNSPVYITFGKAIPTKQYLSEYKSEDNKNFDHILSKSHSALSSIILDIPRDPILRVEVAKWLSAYRFIKFGSIYHRMGFFNQKQSKIEFEQELLAAYQSEPTPYPGSLAHIKSLANQDNLVATTFLEVVNKTAETRTISVIGNGILSFIRILCYPFNACLHLLSTMIANKIVKEPEFWASIRYGVSYVLGWLIVFLIIILSIIMILL